jgi:hypothetical protein
MQVMLVVIVHVVCGILIVKPIQPLSFATLINQHMLLPQRLVSGALAQH